MSSRDIYVRRPDEDVWQVDLAGAARFTWEYDDGRDRMLALYQKGKDKQWDAVKRIDWDIEVDPDDPLGLPDRFLPIYGSRQWEKLDDKGVRELRRAYAASQFSQFLHGEQGAMICAARIVETVPDLDAKFYAATQTIDEARHAEVYSRFLRDKIGMMFPINKGLQNLLRNALDDSRWDMPYLAMQVLIEGLGLAAFGLLRDATSKPLPKQILTYVMQDEARHVAFGRMALRDYYRQLTRAELDERETFIIEACQRMNQRVGAPELYDSLGYDTKECIEYANQSKGARYFRYLLFSRLVPCVRDIGLWSPRVVQCYSDMGVLDAADLSLDDLMARDEEAAEHLDAQRFAAEEAARTNEVAEVIASAAD